MKKLKVRAIRSEVLRERAAKKTAWLQARGVQRVLVVYDDKGSASLYPEKVDGK